MGADAALTKRKKLGVVELFDQLGISLIGESVSAADVYIAVLQPCFGACVHGLDGHASWVWTCKKPLPLPLRVFGTSVLQSGCLRLLPPGQVLRCPASWSLWRSPVGKQRRACLLSHPQALK